MDKLIEVEEKETTGPEIFAVNPPNGFIPPQADSTLDFIVKPTSDLPKDFPITKHVILIQALPAISPTPSLRVPKDWFASRQEQGTWKEKLRVVYTGAFLLRHAVEGLDQERVLNMVKLGGLEKFVNEGDKESGKTALHIAAGKGNLEIVKLLLDSGADKGAKGFTGQTPVYDAVFSGNLEVVEALMEGNEGEFVDWGELKDSRGWNPLHLAASLDFCGAVEFMLERGIDAEVRDNEGRTPLHIAAAQGDGRCVEALLAGGADVDGISSDGSTALHCAASGGHVDIVEGLLDSCANRGIRNLVGQTASDLAFQNGHMEVLQLLDYGDKFLESARCGDVEKVVYWVEKGVELNWRDQFGWSALHCAALKGYEEMVKKLIELGANVEAKDSQGNTPLHCAAYGGHSEVVKILVQNGGDVEAQTLRNVTPSTIATISSFDSVSTVLYDYLDDSVMIEYKV
ncbi:hypothetical protein SUGI_1145740 [Cryptomeria japonica]|nr:hypothetical protein SUGI_1145740 [Cryptomeria japonica]